MVHSAVIGYLWHFCTRKYDAWYAALFMNAAVEIRHGQHGQVLGPSMGLGRVRSETFMFLDGLGWVELAGLYCVACCKFRLGLDLVRKALH